MALTPEAQVAQHIVFGSVSDENCAGCPAYAECHSAPDTAEATQPALPTLESAVAPVEAPDYEFDANDLKVKNLVLKLLDVDLQLHKLQDKVEDIIAEAIALDILDQFKDALAARVVV